MKGKSLSGMTDPLKFGEKPKEQQEFEFKFEQLKRTTIAGSKKECGINKLISKVPFQAAVIDDEYRVFTYMFVDGEVKYVYLYSTRPNA